MHRLCASARLDCAGAAAVRLPGRRDARRREGGEARSKAQAEACASTRCAPAAPGRPASSNRRPGRPCASCTSRPGSSCAARASVESRHKNRAMAMAMMKAELSPRCATRSATPRSRSSTAGKGEISWGYQIPLVRCSPTSRWSGDPSAQRSGRGNIQAVLDGDLDDFIHASPAAHGGSGRHAQEGRQVGRRDCAPRGCRSLLPSPGASGARALYRLQAPPFPGGDDRAARAPSPRAGSPGSPSTSSTDRDDRCKRRRGVRSGREVRRAPARRASPATASPSRTRSRQRR